MLCDLYKNLASSKYEEVTEETKEKRTTFRPAKTAELQKVLKIIWEKDEISAGFVLQKLSEVGNNTVALD